MKCHFGIIIFLFVFHLDEILGQNPLKSYLDCSEVCSKNSGNVGDQTLVTCNCPQSKIIKRDVFDDIKRKIHKDNARKSLNLWTPESQIKKINLKNFSNFQPKGRSAGKLPSNKHAEMYRDLQNRVQELKMRMSAGKHHPHPQFKPRSNFDNKLDVKEYYRKAVEDLHQKYPKNDLFKKNLQNRIDIGSSKLGSVNKKNKEGNDPITTTSTSTTTTERSKVRNIPVVVLMPSSTTTAKPQQETDAKKSDTVLERLKEKQKEAVTKMKDKFSLSKNKEDESEKGQ